MLKKRLFYLLRWTLRFLLCGMLALLLLFFALVVVIQTPWAQQKIIGYASSFFLEKTDRILEIKRVSLSFDGNLSIKGFYLEDQYRDTLIYSHQLDLRLRPVALLRNEIALDYLKWHGLKAAVALDETGIPNYQYLLDAFVSPQDPLEDPPTNDLPKLKIKAITLNDFLLSYADIQSGLQASLKWETLAINPKVTDLNRLIFNFHKIYWTDLDVHFVAGLTGTIEDLEDPKPSESSTTGELAITLGQLNFHNIRWHVDLGADLMSIGTLGDIRLSDFTYNQAGQWIRANQLKISENEVYLSLPTLEVDVAEVNEPLSDPGPFAWPDWMVKLNHFEIESTSIEIERMNSTRTPGKFNPDHLFITDFNTFVSDINLDRKIFGLQLRNLHFAEHSGFGLQQLEGRLTLSNEHLQLDGWRLTTPNLAMVLEGALDYPTIHSLINEPEKTDWSLLLQMEKIAPGDLAYFTDLDLQQDIPELFKKGDTSIKIKASGQKDQLNIDNFSIQTGKASQLILTGQVNHPFDSTRLQIPNMKLIASSKAIDLNTFLEDTVLLPEFAQLTLIVSGDLKKLSLKTQLESDIAVSSISGQIEQLLNNPIFALEGEITIPKAQKISRLDDLSGTPMLCLQAEGSQQPKGMDARGRIELHNLEFADYFYETFFLSFAWKFEHLASELFYKDRNLDVLMQNSIRLADHQVTGQTILNLKGINLQGLKLTDDALRLGAKLQAGYSLSDTGWAAEVNTENGVIIKDARSFEIGRLAARAQSSKWGTFIDLESGILDLALNSNMEANEIQPTLTSHFKSYFSEDVPVFDQSIGRFLNIEGEIKNSLVLREVFIPGLESLEPGRVLVHFDESQQLFDADINLPGIIYQGILFEDWRFALDSRADSLGFQMSLKSLESGPLKLYDTQFNGDIDKAHWELTLKMNDSLGVRLFQIETLLKQEEEQRVVRIGQQLILNRNSWQVPPDNRLSVGKTGIHAHNFIISRNQERIGLVNPTDSGDLVNLIFDQFFLESLIGFLNPENPPVTGLSNGQISFIQREQRTLFTAALIIEDLVATGIPLGVLTIDAQNPQSDLFLVDINLIGEDSEAYLSGNYRPTPEGNLYALEGNIRQIGLGLIAQASSGALSDARGTISSSFFVRGGGQKELEISGNLKFADASFKIRDLNTSFTLSDERVNFENRHLYFDQFKMLDQAKNTATLDGEIDMTNLIAPEFKLDLTANNFLLINTQRIHNDLFFGKLLVDLNMRLRGNATRPLVQSRLKLNRGTALTFIIPESELAEIEREGVVQFTNVRNPQDPLTANTETTGRQNILGVDIRAQIEVDRETEFRVVVDERSGDFLQMRGAAALIFDLSANGRMNLSGQYEITDGRYELSFYDLVRRRFDFKQGSTINWNGDPLDALLDLTAIYQVRTAPRDLMTAQLSGADQTTRTKYNQELPFEVYLLIDGEMIRPRIRFKLDMPQNSRGELGGNVYARVQQLNEDESELNKQVFALLVINGFIPETGGTASGATASMVRSSVSQLLTDQLNNLSDRFVKGVDLDLGVDSYTDYRTGAAQERTQLNVNVSKQLFDDRLIIAVGSNVDLEGERARDQQNMSDLIGNISIEYLLNQEGSYRLKAFRRNQFEGVLDGQLITTGVSLRYNKEFNRFKELWGKKEEDPKLESANQKKKRNP
jgi:translocation and assembly module TamB